MSTQTHCILPAKLKEMYLLIILIVYTVAMPFLLSDIRAGLGVTKVYGEILGFKEFIETAELDRINELVRKRTFLLYNILPYAYVLGLTDKWINKFNTIKI